MMKNGEGLIPEGLSIDGSVASCKSAGPSKCAREDLMKYAPNK
jgi:hypothetical protein